MVVRSISHHLETKVETILLVGIYRGIMGVFRWCRISFIHSGSRGLLSTCTFMEVDLERSRRQVKYTPGSKAHT